MTHPFPKSVDASVKVWEWIGKFISEYRMCDYLSLLGIQFPRVSKRAAKTSADIMGT